MAIENGVNYSLRLIEPILRGEATAIDVKLDAEKAYTSQIQTALQDTVWLSGCNSWYNRTQDGILRNAMAYPYSQAYFWYRCLFPVYKDFDYDVSWSPISTAGPFSHCVSYTRRPRRLICQRITPGCEEPAAQSDLEKSYQIPPLCGGVSIQSQSDDERDQESVGFDTCVMPSLRDQVGGFGNGTMAHVRL